MKQTRLESLQEFLKADPTDPFTRYAIALEYASLKQFEVAIQHLEALAVTDPSYVPAFQQLGLLYVEMGQPAQALKAYERGIQAAALTGDTHAQREMQEAIDELDM